MSHYFTIVGDPGAADSPVFLGGNRKHQSGDARDEDLIAVNDRCGSAGAHHEPQGTGVDVGVVHAAVDFIRAVPV